MVAAGMAISLLAGGCASAPPGPSAGSAAPAGSIVVVPSGAPIASGPSSFAPLPAAEEATYLAAAETELTSRQQLRTDALVADAIGPQGVAVLAATDELEIAFGEQAMAEFVAKLGLDLTAATRQGGRVAAVDPLPPLPQVEAWEWSGSLFGATSFMISTWMGFAPELLRDAGRDQFVQQRMDKTETHDSTIDGLREHLVLTQKLTVGAGRGRLVFDVVMTSAAVLSKPTGEEVARRTSTGNGHFEVNACPDANGVGEGRYRIINQEMVTRPGGLTNGGASTTEATFRLINGDDSRLVRTEVEAAVTSGVHGTTVPSDGGAGQAIDWNAQATFTVVIPARGSATIAGVRNQASNNATESNVGALTTQLVMADYYLAEAAKKAEAFWRSGECIDMKPSEESREVSPNEALTVRVEPEGKFDKQPVKAPVTAAFTGKARLEPNGTAQDPPASLTFTAGSEENDKGTIELKQTGKRGIGKKTVEFTVGIPDYKLGNTAGPQGSLSAVKCRGKDGPWSIAMTAPNTSGTITFTIPRGGTSAQAHMVYDVVTGDASAHWDMRGPVSFVAGDPPILDFGTMNGRVTVRALGESLTTDNKTEPFRVILIPGKFCT